VSECIAFAAWFTGLGNSLAMQMKSTDHTILQNQPIRNSAVVVNWSKATQVLIMMTLALFLC